MGHTASIRFTELIDPRVAWEAARVAVGAPADWTWHGLPDDYPQHLITNLLRQADPCGAAALVTMFYRPEGALLDDTEWDDDEAGRPPAAYLEIHLDTRWEHADANLERAHKIVAELGAPAAVKDGLGGDWSVPPRP